MTQYFLSKGGKTVGPCHLDDLRSYLAYGSVKDTDLVMRQGESEWQQLRVLEELQLEHGMDFVQDITRKRRVARYREYEKVPPKQRSGLILQQMIVGFLFFPPKLWKAAASVFQDRIYRRAKDEAGFLRYWPRWVEFVMQVLLIMNAALWLLLLWILTHNTMPIVRELVKLLKTGLSDLQTWMGQ